MVHLRVNCDIILHLKEIKLLKVEDWLSFDQKAVFLRQAMQILKNYL